MESNEKCNSRLPLPKTSNVFATIGERMNVNVNENNTNRFGLMSFIPKPASRLTNDQLSNKFGFSRVSNTTVGKAPKTRVGSLSTMSRVKPYPLRIVQKQTQVIEAPQMIAQRLDFDKSYVSSKTCADDYTKNDSPQMKSQLISFTTPLVNPSDSLGDDTLQCISSSFNLFSPLNIPKNESLKSLSPQLNRSSMTGQLIDLSLSLPKQKPLITKSPIKSSIASNRSLLMTKSTSPMFNWNVINKEAEMIELKTRVAKLESQIEDSKDECKHTTVEFEKKIEKINKELYIEKDMNEELNRQVMYHKQKHDETMVQLNVARDEFSEERDKSEKIIANLRTENNKLTAELSDVKCDNESIRHKRTTEMVMLKNEISRLENELTRAFSEKEILEKHSEKITNQLKNCEELMAELTNAHNEIKRLNDEIKSRDDGAKLSQILNDEIQELRKCQKENERLKLEIELLGDSTNKEPIMQEEIIVLKEQLKAAHEELQETVKNEIELENVRKQISEWYEMFPLKTPKQISDLISDLQSNASHHHIEINSLKSQINELSSTKMQSESDLQSAQMELTEHRKKLNEQNGHIKKLNRKCILFSKEKESYKKLISSYEHDVTIDVNRVSQERISSLEATLEEYKTLLEQLEDELKQYKEKSNVETHEREINDLKIEVSQLKTLNSELEKQSLPISTDDKYHVMHFKMNPLMQNIEYDAKEYKRLIEENRELLARLQLLESGSDADITKHIEEGVKNAQELEKMRLQLASYENKQKHIINAFKKTSSEFREVCYMLTGYRIDALKQKIYRLSHMYADSQNDVLLFELEGSGTVKLLGNPYSQRLSEMVQTYLTHHDSFPAFLASHTLDLFGKQTHYVEPN